MAELTRIQSEVMYLLRLTESEAFTLRAIMGADDATHALDRVAASSNSTHPVLGRLYTRASKESWYSILAALSRGLGT